MSAHFSWENGFNPTLLLEKLTETRKVVDQRVELDSFASSFWTPILSSAVRASTEAAALKDTCIKNAIFNPDSKLSKPAQFIKECEKAFKQLVGRPTERFFLFCSVTYEGKRLFETLVDPICTLTWAPAPSCQRYKRALLEREKISDLIKRYSVDQPSTGLTDVLVEVKAASAREAAEIALDAIDRFRGIINLLANNNAHRLLRFGTTTQHAVNRFRRGPFATIHKNDGELATEIVWYEPRWFHNERTIEFSPAQKELQKDIRRWWKRARNGPLAEHIGIGLIRYCHALDDHDLSLSMLRLWATLEMLTATTNAKYDITVNRIVRLFSDNEDARQVAEHIRKWRNANVHTATVPDGWDIDAIIHHAELLCSKLLQFCLVEGSKFSDVSELCSFLDSDLDLASLKRKRRIANSFMAFRNRIAPDGKKPRPQSPAKVSYDVGS